MSGGDDMRVQKGSAVPLRPTAAGGKQGEKESPTEDKQSIV